MNDTDLEVTSTLPFDYCTDVHIVKESGMPKVGRTCESEKLVGAPSSSGTDASMQQNQEEEDVWVRIEIGETDSKSNKSADSTATRQSNEDDVGDSDSTSGVDSEVFLIPLQIIAISSLFISICEK